MIRRKRMTLNVSFQICQSDNVCCMIYFLLLCENLDIVTARELYLLKYCNKKCGQGPIKTQQGIYTQEASSGLAEKTP